VRLAGDAAVKGVVITSAKNSFIAGADLKELVGVFDSGMSDGDEIYDFARSFTLLFRKLETCGKPLVAAINGTALGGGLELCLACHHRVAIDDPKAKLGLPEVQVGLLPGAGGTQRLPRLIGIEKALPLMAEGTHLDPAKAHALGIVQELAADGGSSSPRRASGSWSTATRAALGQEGLQVSRGRRREPAGHRADLHGRHGAGRAEDHAQLPGADRHPVLRLRGQPRAHRQGAGDRERSTSSSC
jgi:enoyl-CoA hydratase/carnithine racemase